MAEVYRAYHVSLDRFVAIKVLHAFLADDPEFKNRFEKEARNIARLKHPHIVQVYDFEMDADSETFFMVMELVEGPTLKELLFRLKEQGELMPVMEALRIIREAAKALAYAHSQNMIHRDVKPANLMLDRDDRVVLADFGIAKIVTGVQFTASGGMVGTPAYMAPEQGLGEAGDERSDLYSLGVILFQLLTGRLPYDADTPLAVILKHLNEPIPSARELNPTLPESVDKVIARLLAKDPIDRYQTATDLIADLEKIERGETVEFKDGTPLNRPEAEEQDTENLRFLSDEVRAMRRRRRLSAVGWVTAGLVGLIGIVLVVLSGMDPSPFAGFAGIDESETPSVTTSAATAESDGTEVALVAQTPAPTRTAVTRVATIPRTLIATPTPTVTLTPSPTDTPVPPTATYTLTPSMTQTPSQTFTPSITPTPTITLTPTLDLTLTLLQATQFFEYQTATTAHCDYDYRIVEQNPREGDFFPAGRNYTREIVLQNSGNCPWERLTALVFVPGSGENFGAEPYIFIRERVPVGETTTVIFQGRTPSTACRQNNQVVICAGRWELRTPGQRLVGDQPLTISVNVFEGG